jgi:phosphoribosyl 1,2-cyclic phosphate phosphodiesterase
VLDVKNRTEELGITNEKTRWILTHFSHTGGSLHRELETGVADSGFQVAWDGMTIDL